MRCDVFIKHCYFRFLEERELHHRSVLAGLTDIDADRMVSHSYTQGYCYHPIDTVDRQL